MADKDVPVLVVGGSLVGLSTSLFLASRGVPHMVVERHSGTAIHPRAASFHQRTMEMFRGAGLQRAVEEAAQREFVQNGAIVAVESLGGKELAHFYRSFNEGVEDLSPTSRLFITQVGLEPVLRDRAQALGADHRFSTELVSFEQDAHGVTAVVRPRDGGPAETVRAQYLVAADGAHSQVRDQLGIAMEGRGAFADCVTIYFKADVRELIGDRNLSVVYVNQPGLLAFFRFSITGDSGFLAIFRTDSEEEVGAMDTDRAAAYVRRALGSDPQLPVEVENIQRWTAAAAWAERFQDGRVFLAGDAAHVMPPTGGFGGNTGVADAHNLAWKLAAVLDRTADPALLDTYGAERKPVCAAIVEQAYTRYVGRVDPSLPTDGLAEALDDASIELGTVYHSTAVVTEDPTAGPELDDPRRPSGRPGTRLAHVVLEQDGAPISLHDLVGSGFTLLAGPGSASWVSAAEHLAAATGVPVSVHQIGGGSAVRDTQGTFLAATGIHEDGAVLVRPDGVIAWRSVGAHDDAGQVLGSVIDQVTGRAAATTPAPAEAATV